MDTESSNETVVKMNSTTENKDVEPVKTLETSRKNSKGDKLRKKDDKSVEQVLKALNSLETTEEKLAAMCKKYADIVDENRKLQLAAKQGEKKCCILQREKEQLQTEHSKAVLSRSRLESLCRELQRQNKAIKEESLQKVREEEEKRKEVSAKFQGTLNEITTLMQQNIEKNSKLKEENVEMAQRFGKLLEQYEIREQQVEKLVEQIHIETELGEARIAKARMEMASEKEAMLREKQTLLLELEECRGEIRGLQENDLRLRGQLNLYTDKYDEFKTALTRSSEVFNSFKGEMEKMSKKICKLEKETTSWKQKWEHSHQALLEMAADKQQRDGELALANRRLTQMQALCRTLQAERSALLAQLRGVGSEGIKDVDKGGDNMKVLDEPKGVAEMGPKETVASTAVVNNKLSDPTQGVCAESSKETSALSSTNLASELKKGDSCVPVLGNETDDLKTSGSSAEVVNSISTSALLDSDDSVKNTTSHCDSHSDGNGGDSFVKESSVEEAIKKSDSVLVVDANLPEIPFTDVVNECKSSNVKLSGESPVKVNESPDELLLLTCVGDGGATKEVGATDFGAEKESIIEELNSLKQKLDSCIISDVRPSINEGNQNIIVGDLMADKLEEHKTQLEDEHLKISCPKEVNSEESEDKCNSISAAESIVKELKCENICDISTGSNSADMKTPSPNVCDKNGTVPLTDGITLDKESKENIGLSCGIVAETAKVGEVNAVNCPEKNKSELEVTPGEKPVVKNSAPNVAPKKPDAQVNSKKGKESSRKRKR